MTEEKALAVQDTLEAVPVAAIVKRVEAIQQVMKAVMKEGVHFGKVPGCGDKPTLLKPGAEKLLETFRIAADLAVEDLSSADAFRYRVTAKGISPGGEFLGAGVGEASSDEDKYHWRKAVSDAEFEAVDPDRRRIKYASNYTTKQVRTNPADLANTVLKISKKRALVDMALTVTGASDMLTQDIEDLPEEYRQQAAGKEAGEPKGDEPNYGKCKCGKPLAAKERKAGGYFLSCTGYPECKIKQPYREPVDKPEDLLPQPEEVPPPTDQAEPTVLQEIEKIVTELAALKVVADLPSPEELQAMKEPALANIRDSLSRRLDAANKEAEG